MSKIIIHKQCEVSDAEALWLVLSVVKNGRISDFGKCYCLASVGPKYAVIAQRTRRGTDVFRIQNANPPSQN